MKPHFSDTRQAGELLFVSGQLAFDEDLELVPGDVAAQTSRCLHNMERILQGHGLGLNDVVKTTVWLQRREDFAAFNLAYAAAFPIEPPTRSTVVAQLVVPGALVEIECVAHLAAR
jgi:2-iminobutanoate/2-iminopropanoate deaminase